MSWVWVGFGGPTNETRGFGGGLVVVAGCQGRVEFGQREARRKFSKVNSGQLWALGEHGVRSGGWTRIVRLSVAKDCSRP